MGLLVDGKWHDDWYDTASSGGRFQRFSSTFRNWVTADGSAGPSGEAGFRAEAGRYHLYVAYSCPWAHRTLIWRQLKGLVDAISVSIADSTKDGEGWTFRKGEGLIPDALHGATYLHQLYTKAEPNYTGRVLVPTLWDKQRQTIVNNESSEIIRMFDLAFGSIGAGGPPLYPEPLRAEIDRLNARIYETVNNGVYRAGFATTRAAYEEAVRPLFQTLDDLEARLASRRYLFGAEPNEADWRLFPTLVRFDVAYHGNFKCNLKRLVDYPNLWAYTRDLYQRPGIAESINFTQIKRGYYTIRAVNPTGVVPLGPEIDFTAPHGRERLQG